MATNFSPVLGVLCFKGIPKYCNVWYERILRISKWSDTGPSWPSCFNFGHRSHKGQDQKDVEAQPLFLLQSLAP